MNIIPEFPYKFRENVYRNLSKNNRVIHEAI